ncbi:MAG: hypothetical protein KDD01_15610 [Phaeodactylibacter sp.]|nr:hypothetical protein [Phaeodactylibacter sp.]
MKLTATELSTLVTALDDQVKEVNQLLADPAGTSEEGQRIILTRAVRLEILRAKLKTELQSQIKTLKP